MRKTYFLNACWCMCVIMAGVVFTACSSDDDGNGENTLKPFGVEFTGGTPPAQAFSFGETKTINITSSQVSYFTYDEPYGWTIETSAAKDMISITSPDESIINYDMDGTIELTAHNRASGQTAALTLKVGIDLNILDYGIEFNDLPANPEEFSWGETRRYNFSSRYLNDITSSNINGWGVRVTDGFIDVTAPQYSTTSTIAIGGSLVLSGAPLNGSAAITSSPLEVVIPVYKVDISGIGDAKLYEVQNTYGEAVAIVAREYVTLNDEITSLYVYDGSGYTEGLVFDNGGTISFDGSTYTEGTAAVSSVLFSYDGKFLGEVEGNPVSTTLAEATVSDYDGNSYGILKAADLFWMNENLRVMNSPRTGEALDVLNVPIDFETVGCMYSRAVAWDLASGTSVSDPHQGICPSGWHLPSENEGSKYVVAPHFLYNSLSTNYAGLMTPQGMAIAIAAYLHTTGAGLQAMPTMMPGVITLSGTYHVYGTNVRCIKDTPVIGR